MHISPEMPTYETQVRRKPSWEGRRGSATSVATYDPTQEAPASAGAFTRVREDRLRSGSDVRGSTQIDLSRLEASP